MSVAQELIELQKACRKAGENFTREAVLKFAEVNTNSALWHDFEANGLWDEETAAEKARLAHAGAIIMRYKIRRSKAVGNKVMRGFIHLGRTDTDDTVPGYVLTEEALAGDSRNQVIETIVRRVLGEMTNYPLNEFAPIIDACYELLGTMAPKPAPQPHPRPRRGTSPGGEEARP